MKSCASWSAPTLAELRAQGAQLGAKDMGMVMKAVQTKIQASGLRADGRLVSEMVKGRGR